jgi:LTXXQ motif family protein
MNRAILAAALLATLSIAALDAQAQGMSRRDRGGATRDSQNRDTPRAADATGQDPFAALEHELPSLAVDLQLSAAQVSPWNTFQRDVRDVAEIGRAQRRHVMSLREGGEGPPTALAMVAAIAEDERLKSEATAELQHHLETLYAGLTDTQKRTLDRRVVLSQTEPLGH